MARPAHLPVLRAQVACRACGATATSTDVASLNAWGRAHLAPYTVRIRVRMPDGTVGEVALAELPVLVSERRERHGR